MPTPLVTVCIPTYNRSWRLCRTIDTVLGQTFEDWELILIDDGSTDDTPVIVQSYTDSRVRRYQQQNRGHSFARNKGLELARGKYIAFLDHDDRWLPEKLQRQVAYLDEHGDTGLVYCRRQNIDEEGRNLGDVRNIEASGWVLETLFRENNFIQSMSVPMMRTDIARRVGGFDPRTGICDDLDLFLKLACVTKFGFVAETLVEYNVGNENQQTRDYSRLVRDIWICYRLHARKLATLSRDARAEISAKWKQPAAAAFRDIGWKAFQDQDYQLAMKSYLASVRLAPSQLTDFQLLKDLVALCKRSLTAAIQ